MNKVYLLHHTYYISEDNENIKLIGVFSSKAKAQETIKKYRELPGFKDSKENFHIDMYQIDETHWNKGFFTE